MSFLEVKFLAPLRLTASLIPALVLAGTLSAQTSINMVYVESNIGKTANQNSVYAYSNSAGKLTQLKGSPYLTGGTGVFSSTASMAPALWPTRKLW
jgi:hypothetical protein